MKIVYGQSQSAAFVVVIVENNKKVDKDRRGKGRQKEEGKEKGGGKEREQGKKDTLCY